LDEIMASWSEFEASEPEMAAAGHEALFRSGSGEGLLTTLAGAGLPRTHPVNVGIVDGRLMTFVQARSAKARDLLTDGRYALHAHLDPKRPDEFLLRGRATVIADATTRATAIASWPFSPDASYPLVELDIEHALFGDRADPDSWPPVYTSWRPT
jgi:hypothetical protein